MSAPRRRVLVVLAAAGLLVASYLTLYQLGVLDRVWDGVFGASSSRSVLDLAAPVPDAAAGAAAYACELVLLTVFAGRRWATVFLGLILAGGALVSLALIVVQATVAGDWCLLCLASAAISLTLFCVGRGEVRASADAARRRARASGW